ncbi:MAG: CDP-diacylglycerol--serine O-phosphatidyltransferase [Bacteroidales bacterium]
MKSIPNTITLINLFLGCVAIVMTLQGQPGVAAIIIGLCAVLDFLDGAVARVLRAGSPIGQQLDSLADLVSFGVAPSAILYYYLQGAFQLMQPGEPYILLPSLAFLVAVFSCLRLARFNIDEAQKNDFRGLPTPASALLIASIPFVLTYTDPDALVFSFFETFITNIWPNLGLIFVISWLLVSPVRMFSLKVQSMTWKDNKYVILFFSGCLLLLIVFGLSAVPLFLIFYLLLSLVYHVQQYH